MNETELSGLLKGFGDSIGPCSKTPGRAQSRFRSKRFALASTLVLALALAAIGLWPRDAVAGALSRLHYALTNVSTLEERSFMKLPTRWYEYSRTYIKGDQWRLEEFRGTNLEFTRIIHSGMTLTNYTRLDHATLEATAESDDAGEGMSALDFAKSTIDMGQNGEKRTIVVRGHEPVDGKATYVIVVDDAGDQISDQYHAEILVDKLTDLPIRSEMSFINPTHGLLAYRSEYQFNRPLDSKLFTLDRSRSIVNLEQAQADLGLKWTGSLGSADGTKVQDVCETQDGTLWVAVTTSSPDPHRVMPVSIQADNGADYVLAEDVTPSGYAQKERARINGEAVFVSCFVPLQTQAPRTKRLSIRLARRNEVYLNTGSEAGPASKTVLSIAVAPRILASGRPDYFTALDLDRFGFQIPNMVWMCRAKALEKSGKLIEAAHAYEGASEAYSRWVKYSAYKPLEDAARCYRAAGDAAKADALLNKSAAIHATMER
jgi:phage gp46-like protein